MSDRDRTTQHEVDGIDTLVFQGGYYVRCNCRPDDGIKCQFHARLQPKTCPECKSGKLTRMKNGECNAVVYNKVLGRKALSTKPVWTCNTCEYCEMDK